jgi:predicted acyl esterase/ankyrin repeat protein
MGNKHKIYYIAAIVIFVSFCDVLAGSDSDEIKVIVERNVPVPMRDCTILRADVHRPDRGGPYPVLVQRTQYGKDDNFDRFVKAGYIVVSQDIRGRYASEGKWDSLFLSHEAEDGYDTVEWAAKIPGSNHKVGTFGASALATEQWLLASLCPPSLVAMSAQRCAPPRRYQALTGSILPYLQLRGMWTITPDARRQRNLPGIHTSWEGRKLWGQGDSDKWLYFLPWKDLPIDLHVDQTGHDRFIFYFSNSQFDWKLDERCKNISVPNLDVTGWYDFCNADMLMFRTMASEAKTEVARKSSKIIIGPWVHSRLISEIGTIDFGPAAALDDIAVQIRWFDYWIKGIQNGVDKDAPVRMFVMGDNKWRNEQSWPLQRAKERSLFIASRGNANTPMGDGKLVHQEPEQTGKDQYLYDPKNPVPTAFDPIGMFMPADQRPLMGRNDILVYQTEPLLKRIEVTGNPIVEFHAASSAPDTDWFVRLIDVYPDGLTMDVSVGAVRARYRNGFDRPTFIKPGEVVKYSIRMRPTSNAFLPGHRIRLDITSSDFPNFDRNHNTATDQFADATLVVANQTIYHGGEYPTRIILPWVSNPPEEEKLAEEEKAEEGSVKHIYALHQAVANGDIEQVRMLISKGSNIDSEDQNESTPLYYAVKSGNMEIIKSLMEAGADVNAGSRLPLFTAVEQDNLSMAEYLITHGADVNAPEGWTALQMAVSTSTIEMVKLLIAKGADINVGSWPPLHGAVDKGRRDIVELLIKEGADLSAKDSGGCTPLYYATQNNNLDIIKLLVAKGADIKTVTPKGLMRLHYMSTYDSPDIVEWLLAKGAKVDERDDNYEFTALHYAARFGSTKVAKVLIAHGADIRAKDKWGYQPIHWAAYHDRPEIIELLIAEGADVNAKTSLGQTPLELAIPRRNTAAIEVLRKHGAKE